MATTEYGIHVKTASGTVEVLKPGIDRRVTALENKNAEQDTAIANAQSAAQNAQNTANNAQNTANNALPKSGGTMTGQINMNGQSVVGVYHVDFSNGTSIWVE